MSTDTISAAELREDQHAQSALDARLESVTTKQGATRPAPLVQRALDVQREARRVRGAMAGVEDETLLEAARERVNELRWGLLQVLSDATDGQHTAGDFYEGIRHSMSMRAPFPRIFATAVEGLARVRLVPNHNLREAVISFIDRSGMDWVMFARLVGARLAVLEGEARERGDEECDFGSTSYAPVAPSRQQSKWATDKLRLHIGAEAEVKKDEVRCPFLITYERAVAIAHVINIPPHELGV